MCTSVNLLRVHIAMLHGVRVMAFIDADNG